MSKIINLQNHISSGSVVLSGREKGEKLRQSLKLDELEDNESVIKIKIPDAIVSFNSSFFLGLFTPSIKKFHTKEGFFEKYEFDCDDYLKRDVEDGVDEALKVTNII